MIYKSSLTENYYKLGEVAKLLGVNPMTNKADNIWERKIRIEYRQSHEKGIIKL